MTLCHLKVHRVVSRGDFDCPGAEFRVNRFISNDGYYSIHCGQDYLFADHILKPFIFRVDGYCGIAEYRLRSGSRHGDKIFIVIRQRIADIVQVPADIFMLHFKVGDGGSAAGAPVDNPLSPVN
ncbi:hypothetical protein ES703_99457 [subsurface metagenome]